MERQTTIHEPIFHKGWVLIQSWNNISNRLLLMYCCLGLLLLPFYQFQIDPDGISYINIAHLYAVGNFRDAINAFWGPLISWLLIPLVLVKLQPLFAFKVLSLIISGCTLLAIRRLSFRFALNERVRFFVLLASMPMLLSYTLFAVSPDLLLLCLMLCYLSYMFDVEYAKKAMSGLIIGLLGALLYFCKSYGFDFFIAHFSLFTLIYVLSSKTGQERKNVLLKFFLAIAMFFVLSGVWIGAISTKYHHFTTSTSGEYNIQLDSLGSRGQPMLYQGLLPLSYPSAYSAWDDPTTLTIDYDKSPSLFSWVTYQVVHTSENVFHTLFYFELFSLFSIIVLLLYLIGFFRQRFRRARVSGQINAERFWARWLPQGEDENDKAVRRTILFTLITMFLYTAGYQLLHIESRFLWLDAILLLLLCACYVQNQHFTFIHSSRFRQWVVYIVFLSFCLYPTLILTLHENEDTGVYMTSKQLQTVYHVKGNFASNDDGDLSTSWGLTLFYAYFLDSKYYGATQHDITDAELHTMLQKYHINYYFSWNNVCRLKECKKVAEMHVQFLWTYDTKKLIVYQIRE